NRRRRVLPVPPGNEGLRLRRLRKHDCGSQETSATGSATFGCVSQCSGNRKRERTGGSPRLRRRLLQLRRTELREEYRGSRSPSGTPGETGRESAAVYLFTHLPLGDGLVSRSR